MRMMLNPIFESSARRRMRTARTPLILTAYIGLLLAFSLSRLSLFFGQGVTVSQMRQSTEWYIWLTALQFLLIVLVAPALSAGSIAGERERQTFDLLLVTGVGARRIVLGKVMEDFAFLTLMVLCGVPVMALACVTGGITLAQVLATAGWLLVIALEALCVGMLASAMCRRSLSAMISAYLMVFALGAGAWALAKHGPLAARYTVETLRQLPAMGTASVLAGMPLTVFFCPAVGLVTLLAHQTGILHNTMENTLRLYHIYHAAKAAGFGATSAACLVSSLAASCVLIAASIGIVRLQTGGKRRFGR